MASTSSIAKRGGVLFLAHPAVPDAPKGTCRWCGHKLKGSRASIRRYCYPDREGRDCAQAFRDSMTWNPRQALLVIAQREGKELRCADCGFFVGVRLNDEGRYEERAWEADHEIPLWDGGEHTVENLRARCCPCHAAKTARESARRAASR
jgi:5-methylcytosine-specific restriction endonuclease McrA